MLHYHGDGPNVIIIHCKWEGMLTGVLCVDLLIGIYTLHVHVTCTGTAVE